MAYSKFTLDLIEEKFGIKNEMKMLFGEMPKIAPSDWLKTALQIAQELPIKSEKAKSESIVFPLLVELRNRNNKYFTIHSGDFLTADKGRGLDGECDFILAKDIQTFNINYPIFQLLKAKKHDTALSVPQCAAQMLGAKIFNEKKGIYLPCVYGCVTTGKDWLFMKLEDKIYIDKKNYSIERIDELLGVFQSIIDYYKMTI